MTTWTGRKARRLRAACLATYGTICHLCGGAGADTADHIIPRSHGGTDDLANLRPAHATCNYSRRDMSLDDWHATWRQRRPPSARFR